VAGAAAAVSRLLSGPGRQRLKQLAKQLRDNEHIFVVGRESLYPVALEAALKIKEVSYIHAEAYAAGEIKHGPIALITQGSPCVIFGEAVNSAHELKARGAFTIGIGTKPDPIFNEFFQVPDLAEATAIPLIVAAQLLAYDLAVARGFNPDKPRNLAKSVTVK
jgi:glucosamine--fructose-6-phosphate aminotransferase (isomerizing)